MSPSPMGSLTWWTQPSHRGLTLLCGDSRLPWQRAQCLQTCCHCSTRQHWQSLGLVSSFAPPITLDWYSLLLYVFTNSKFLVYLLPPIFFPPVYVYGAGHLEQPQISSTKMLSKTARLECVVSGVTISETSIYWYRERPGEVIQFLVCILYDGTVRKESSIPSGKFEVDRIPKTSTSTLTIHNVQKQDIATYYCALWEVHSNRQLEPSHSINVYWVFVYNYELGSHSYHQCACK